MTRIYVNLSAGLLQREYVGAIVRIQSSLLESHCFDRLFYGLCDDLLFNLARGQTCMIVDCSSNKIGKVERRGVPIIRAILNHYWGSEYFHKYKLLKHEKLGEEYFNRIRRSLSKPTKQKLKFYRKYLPDDFVPIKLIGKTIHVEKEA